MRLMGQSVMTVLQWCKEDARVIRCPCRMMDGWGVSIVTTLRDAWSDQAVDEIEMEVMMVPRLNHQTWQL